MSDLHSRIASWEYWIATTVNLCVIDNRIVCEGCESGCVNWQQELIRMIMKEQEQQFDVVGIIIKALLAIGS